MIWALANPNLALVKYWGKADETARHPAGPSLSVTLDSLVTLAGIEIDGCLQEDRVDGLPPAAAAKVRTFLDRFRARFRIAWHAHVVLASNFPVAAGLASSASTFAALAKAAVAAARIEIDASELAAVARLGSGSACRSVYGGFVEWRPEGGGSVVEPVAAKDHWALKILVAVTSDRPKAVGSSEGMKRTAATSPYYRAWIESGAEDLASVREAILRRDVERLGATAERNCLRMHAAAMAADPPLLYWEPATLAVMRRVWELRERGTAAYFTIDAGPQVKVLCEADVAQTVRAAITGVPGVLGVIASQPGDPPRVVEAPPAWAQLGAEPQARRAVAS